jgi:hypothetical protein
LTVSRQRYEDICDALTAWHAEVRRSTIFGMPCLKRGRRVVCGFSRGEGAMVFRLLEPAAHAGALALSGAHFFDPSGRGQPFRDWVVVPVSQAEAWEGLAYAAATQELVDPTHAA